MVQLRARDGGDPRGLAAMDIDVHLDDKTLKRKYVVTMFDILAPGYDTFTRLFSFGMDRGWKALLVNEGVKRTITSPRILDLACGTGGLGSELAHRTKASLALGFDFSHQMLSEASRRLRNDDALSLVACDMLELCVADSECGYGQHRLRHSQYGRLRPVIAGDCESPEARWNFTQSGFLQAYR